MSLPESAQGLLDDLVKRVRALPVKKRIVFPEGADPRVLEAATRLAAEGLVTPILVGKKPANAPGNGVRTNRKPGSTLA